MPAELPDDEWLRRSIARATAKERDALRIWTTDRHKEIQAALRGHVPMTTEIATLSQRIDTALARDPLPRAFRLRRIVGRDAFPLGDLRRLRGRSRTELGYIATTLNSKPPKIPVGSSVAMHLTARRGTPAVHLVSVSHVPGQGEVLLGRGLAVYATDARYHDVERRWEVDAYVRP